MRSLILSIMLLGCASSAQPTTSPPAAAKAVSTLDPRVQRIVREELDRAVAEWKSSKSVAIAIEPSTGAILAVEGRDGTHDDPSMATVHTFVTGSTLKTITFAAALEEKTIAPDAKLDCATRLYGTHELHDASPHGVMSLSEVLATSSNVGTSRVYDTLGLDRLYTYLRRFHFDDGPSHLPTVTDGASIQAAELAVGELAEATPMQMAAAYAAIVNGGSYIAPTTTRGSVAKERVLGEGTVKTIMAMLEGVVTSGTGKLARIEGHRVAGKTGTGDHHGQYYGSFVGTVLDAKTPFVVLVGFELPQSSGYTGASAAAPVFARIATRILALT
ncbi:MAG: penicillin-binding transpeptidase domain-containing protein [Polyangiales bacterium]